MALSAQAKASSSNPWFYVVTEVPMTKSEFVTHLYTNGIERDAQVASVQFESLLSSEGAEVIEKTVTDGSTELAVMIQVATKRRRSSFEEIIEHPNMSEAASSVAAPAPSAPQPAAQVVVVVDESPPPPAPPPPTDEDRTDTVPFNLEQYLDEYELENPQ